MILITGATGTLGSHLLYQLLQNNDKIVALYRSSIKKNRVLDVFGYYTNQSKIFFDKIIWRKADITDIYSLEDAFEGIDKVYHCAAYIDFRNKKFEKYYEINSKGTANIVNIAIDKKIKKLVHVSSIAAIGTKEEGFSLEEDFPNPDEITSFYSKSKYYSELEIWRGIEEGLNAVIVNPSVILAPYFLEENRKKLFRRIFNKGIKYYSCGIKGFVGIDDVVRIMILLMESEISKERFILNAQNLSFKELFDIVSDKIEKPRPRIKLTKNKLKAIKFFLTIISLGKPVLVLRKETERPEAIEMGTVKLSGIEKDQIVWDATELLTSTSVYNRMATAVNPYGDGKASLRILAAVKYYLKS